MAKEKAPFKGCFSYMGSLMLYAVYLFRIYSKGIYILLQVYIFGRAHIDGRVFKVLCANDAMGDTTKPLDIILADDDKDDVEIFQSALQDTGISYEFRHAANGEILFVLLKDNIPYILFLDIEMPCKDGIACILEIRKDRRYDSMPVIMYTSHYRDEYVNDSYRGGANMFVRKRESYSEVVKDLKAIMNTDWGKTLYYPPLDGYVWKQG